jgi:hypothetical protein
MGYGVWGGERVEGRGGGMGVGGGMGCGGVWGVGVG